jgi:hypothetical protein
MSINPEMKEYIKNVVITGGIWGTVWFLLYDFLFQHQGSLNRFIGDVLTCCLVIVFVDKLHNKKVFESK